MSDNIGVGQYAALNSGGPIMIIVDIAHEGLTAAWIDRVGKVQEYIFKRALLTKLNPLLANYTPPDKEVKLI